MSENSVKDILAKFSQGNGPQLGPPPAHKPVRPAKPTNLAVTRDNPPTNGVKSPNDVKSPSKLRGLGTGGQVNLNEITSVKLKKAVPRPVGESKPSGSEEPVFRLQPKPKPKPQPPLRNDTSPSLPSPTQAKAPVSLPSNLSPNVSSLHSNASVKPPALTKKPKPPAPTRKDSLKSSSTSSPPSTPPTSIIVDDENKENHWKTEVGAEEPLPPVSDSENSSASSVTDLPLRRTSFLHNVGKKSASSGKPVLEPLPPLQVLGNAPRKPAKPPNVSLAKFRTTSSYSPPARPPRPGGSGLPSPSTPPSLPARPSLPTGTSRPKPTPPLPVPEEQEAGDSGDIYDDVEGNPPLPEPRTTPSQRPISLIETMDSDEEENIQDPGDIYDDAESGQAPPVLPPHPTLTVTGAAEAPPLPSLLSMPTLHGSGGSSISLPPRSAEHSGSGLEEQEIYDDVSAEGDHDELYEALDVNGESSAEVEMACENEQQKKQEEKRRKEEERLKREQEKQQKKEEEKRKKKEREEKKKKEKDLRKKFNIKGDINIIDEGIVVEAMDAVYEKLDLQCKVGEKIEILRKEGNPPGKWLARNPGGNYGYVDHQFVRLEGGDSGEVYDDVIAGEDEGDLEEDNIYDAVN